MRVNMIFVLSAAKSALSSHTHSWTCITALTCAVLCREVVERRAHIVTGKKPREAEIDNMIDTGESETIFQKAILEQGRGHVS